MHKCYLYELEKWAWNNLKFYVKGKHCKHYTIVLRVAHTIKLGLWYTYHVISIEPALTFKGWRNHSIEGLTYDLVDITLIHKLMVGVYGGLNGH